MLENKLGMRTIVGFAKRGGNFQSINSEVGRLPAGVYRLSNDMLGEVVYEPQVTPTDDIIVFDKSLAVYLLDEFAKFQAAKDVYDRYKFVHKRAILMYGPPGNGKTSLIFELTSRFLNSYDGIVLQMTTRTDPDLIVQAIEELHSIELDRPIVVTMEEVDVIYHMYPSSFLSMLDGGRDVRSVFFVGTTNYLDKLDPRVSKRPSRFDTVVEVPPPGMEVRIEYLRRKGVGEQDCYRIAEACEGLSFAHLKEFVIAHLILGQPLEDVRKRFVETPSEAVVDIVHDEGDEPEPWDSSSNDC